MACYDVMYKDVKIGFLKVEHGKYTYVPDENGIKEAEKGGDTVLTHLKKETIAETIPFFETRIKNCKRFENVSIGYHMDNYELREVK